MASKKTNKKLPKDAVSEQEIDPLYGYVHGEWNAVGGHEMSYCNPDEYEKYYHEKMHASCSYETTQHEKEDKELNTSLRTGEVRAYTAGSHGHQIDVHSDTNVEKTLRIENGKDRGDAIGGKRLIGVKGKTVRVEGDSKSSMTPGQSGATEYRATTGASTHTHEGPINIHSQDNHSIMNEKNHVHVVGEEWADHAGGNYDFYGNKKFHVYSKDAYIANTDSTMDFWSQDKMTAKSKSDITIESDTKITLKVGSNSIEITSSGITINAQGGKLDLKASGDVTTQGATTKLQGGGNPGIPTTIT